MTGSTVVVDGGCRRAEPADRRVVSRHRPSRGGTGVESCLVNTAATRFLGERPAGAVTPNHRHRSDRTEYLVFSTEPGINYL